MDFKKFLTNRRAIRDYQNKEVPLSIIKEILQDTCLAPTASNRQPCRFIIIQDRDLMKQLSDESKDNLLADGIKNPALLSPDYEARLRDENFNVFYNAPCLVLFIGPKDVRSLDVDVALTVA
jgi:nitroreductase